MQGFIDTEVQARQQLNAEHASRMALNDKVDWLVHIDIDELFYVAPPNTVKAHFSWLSSSSVGNMNYMNFEVSSSRNAATTI